MSRMLRYIQPSGDDISMDFLERSTETKDYIEALKEAKLAPATILTYLKHMIRFCNFLIFHRFPDQELRERCRSYIELLNTLQKHMTEAHIEAFCKTRSIFASCLLPVLFQRSCDAASLSRCDQLTRGQRSVAECQKILRVAKKDMLTICGNLRENKLVSSEEKTRFRYYCVAIIVLGHFQRPGVAEGMSVSVGPLSGAPPAVLCLTVCLWFCRSQSGSTDGVLMVDGV